MKKLKDIIDNFDYYTSDKVNCYEKQIGNVLESYKNNYGNIYLILSKLESFFIFNEGFKYKKMKDYLGIELSHKKYNSLLLNKLIEAQIDYDLPVLIEGDLKHLCYSNYYKEKSWPHLFLIKGYDPDKRVFIIFDNTQYGIIDQKYGDFQITYDMMRELACQSNAGFFETIKIDIDDKDIKYNLSEISIKITSLLIHALKYKANRIEKTLENPNDELDCNIFINFPKYIEVLFGELFVLLKKFINLEHFSIQLLVSKYVNCYKKMSNAMVLQYMRDRKINVGILTNLEEQIKKTKESIISELKLIIRNIKSNGRKNEISVINHPIQNDNDNIILIVEDSITFDFKKNKTYNMWIDDFAPKFIIHNGNIEDFEISISFYIHENYTVEYFQIGFFVTILENTYFAAIDNSNLLVLDVIGENNMSYNTKVGLKQTLLISCENNVLSVYIDNDKSACLSRWIPLSSNQNVCLGILGKTWGKPGKLKIDCKINYFNYTIVDKK